MTTIAVAAHGIIKKGSTFLTIKRSSKDEYMPGKWDFPGGVLDIGEVPEEGVKREIFEETSLQVTVGKVKFVHADFDELPANQYFILVYECVYKEGEVTLNPQEHEEYRWVSREELVALDPMHFIKGWLKQDQN